MEKWIKSYTGCKKSKQKEAQSIRKDHEDWIIQIYCVDLFIIFELINPDIKYIFCRYLLHYITILFLLPGTVVVYDRNG